MPTCVLRAVGAGGGGGGGGEWRLSEVATVHQLASDGQLDSAACGTGL